MKRVLIVLAVVLFACQGKPPNQTITVTPSAATIPVKAQLAMTATIAGSPIAVTWTADCGSVDTTGLYTAPAVAATCHVTATSTQAPSFSGQAVVTVTLPAPVVTITPNAPTVDACKTVQFVGTTDRGALTYFVTEVGGGTVNSSGLYTAPSVSGLYHVVATSDAGGSATAAVTVQDHILGVAVVPATVGLLAGGKQQFVAMVTTSCGTFQAQ